MSFLNYLTEDNRKWSEGFCRRISDIPVDEHIDTEREAKAEAFDKIRDYLGVPEGKEEISETLLTVMRRVI